MRKKNFAFALDNLFWFFVYLLPVIGWLLSLFKFDTPVVFSSFMQEFIVAIDVNNIFISSINGIFGTGGILPLFDTSVNAGIIYFLSYFVTVYFIHIAVDLLMLLPRMLMHAMDKLGGC